jgi:hypothetical protein
MRQMLRPAAWGRRADFARQRSILIGPGKTLQQSRSKKGRKYKALRRF